MAYLAHAVGVRATHNLPLQIDVMSPKAQYGTKNDKITIRWTLNGRWSEVTTVSNYKRNPNGDIVFDDGVDVNLFKQTIMKQGNVECDSRGIRAVWNDTRLTQMAKNMLNQANSALAAISNQMTRDPLRHSDDLDVIDVSEEYLVHAINYTGYQHEGYYSPNNKTYNLLFNGAEIRDNGSRSNPNVWIQFMAPTNGNNVRDTREGDPYVTSHFVSDPRMIKNDSLTRQMVEGSIKRVMKEKSGSNSVAFKLNDVEITKCVATVRRLLTKYQQSHPDFVDHLNVSHSYTVVYQGDELYHHGILGMKWGVRRYQNADGTLTEAGRKRYNLGTVSGTRNALENASSDKERRVILAKSGNKASVGSFLGMATAAGSRTAATAAKGLVEASKAAIAANGGSSVLKVGSILSRAGLSLANHTSYISLAAPAWATAMMTPVGQIALGAATVAGVGMTVYNAYKAFKLNELKAEFDVSDVTSRRIEEEKNRK